MGRPAVGFVSFIFYIGAVDEVEFPEPLTSVRFCWIKALSAHSCHCRSVGCRIWGDGGRGRNGLRPGET